MKNQTIALAQGETKEPSTLAIQETDAIDAKDDDKTPTTQKNCAINFREFLPMSIAPNFDAIPQVLKDLPRWLCWRLIPNDPKPKKVPMTPKNGELVNASVKDPKNWLTFDEAIKWYQRGESSGIGFAITDKPPKVCCVDIDHCFLPDGTLTDEAQAVIQACEKSFTEISQSGKGVHIWFIDEKFIGGRKKGNVEVYAVDRYMAMTGVHVQSTSKELLTLNGACNAVIDKFIGSRGGNLFDKSAPAQGEEIKLPDARNFETAAPMTDDDRRLVEYFRSEACKQRDLNIFNLFSGNVAEYFKNTGKAFDDSVADCDLMLKILYYSAQEGSDDAIAQHALKIFGQSELAKRDKWTAREDYRIRTIEATFDIWDKNGRKTISKQKSAPLAAQETLQDPLDNFDDQTIGNEENNTDSAPFGSDDKEFDDLIAQWQAANRKEDIDPKTIAELKDAKDFIDALTVDNFDADIVSDISRRRQIALCEFYFPTLSAKVLNTLTAAKNLARGIIKANKDLNLVPDEKAQAIVNISVKEFKAAIKKFVTKIARDQKDYIAKKNLDELNAKIKEQKESIEYTAENVKDCPLNLIIPGDCHFNEGGVSIMDYSGKKPKRYQATKNPVIVTKIFVKHDDDTKEVGYEIAVKSRRKWRTIKLDGVELADSKKILRLAEIGALIEEPKSVCKFFARIIAKNQNDLPLSKVVPRCGWYKFSGKDYFIDPRRNCVLKEDGKNISVEVDDAQSDFAKHLKQVGKLEEWKKAYLVAKKSPVARLIVAAAVAPILLKILGERNFLLYICAPTRAGKSTALYLAASAIGNEKIIRSFDATKNGLAGAAADVNDYAFLVDEKQVADSKLQSQADALIYALGGGIGRTKLNRDSTLKKTQDWRTVAIMNGETKLLSDNVTGGANTRLLTIMAPKEILSAADCSFIRDTIKDNHGLALPLVIDKVVEVGRDKLRKMFSEMVEVFAVKFPETLSEYQRYIGALTLADGLLNCALFGNTVTLPNGETIKTSEDAVINAAKIFPLIPTIAEISDTQREKDFVRAIIAKNQNDFIGGNVARDRMKEFSGKLYDDDGFSYLTTQFLKEACKKEGFDYHKLVADLVADGFFVPSNIIKKDCKKPLNTVQKKIGVANTMCYRIKNEILKEEEE